MVRGTYGGLVRFSISLPQRDSDGFDAAGFKSYLARAEELGELALLDRFVQRLLGRFLSQGFVHHDLSRACLAQTADANRTAWRSGRVMLSVMRQPTKAASKLHR